MHGRGNFRVKFSGVASPSEQHIDDDLAGTGAPDEFCLMDAGVQNLKDLPLTAHIQSINLHCNQIAKIENLQNLRHLRHLDLSSNHLTRIEGLDGLLNLRTLNVACNQLSTITGLRSLKSLLKLNASYNQIHDISGLRELHGSDYSLTHLHLHGNQLSSAEHLIGCLAGLSRLCHVTFLHEQSDNPVCRLPGYRTALFNSLPQLISLDGADRTGITIQTNDGLSDIPGLEQYLEYLLSSDVGSGAEQEKETPLQIITPKIDQVLEKFRQRALASSGASTTEKEDENNVRITALKESHIGQAYPAAHTRSTSHEERLKILEQQLVDIMTRRPQVPEASPSTDSHEEPGRHARKRVSSGRIHVARKDTDPTDDSDSEMGRRGRKHGGKKPATGRQRNKSEERVSKTSKIPTRTKTKSCPSPGSSQGVSTSPSSGLERTVEPSAASRRVVPTTPEQDADKLSLLQELDRERERRWKAEQAAIRLADHIQDVQTKANEERELQEVVVEASGRLKQAVMNEKEMKSRLEDDVSILKGRLKETMQKLSVTQRADEEQRQTLRAMEETARRMESEKLKQQAHDAKRLQEYQLRAAAGQRELELVRVKSGQQEGKVRQLQELLATREQEHRNELQNYYKPGSREIQEMLEKEVGKEREKHEHGQFFYKERIETLTKQYTDLEDEFRLALQIESNRFQEVQDAYERASQDAAHLKQVFSASVEKEKRSSGLVTELTSMVKEQKGRITELSRAKQEAISSTRMRIGSLENQVEESQRKLQILEALRQEKSRLAAQLVAMESVVEGLKAERKLWGQELAQQGVSLAQDRGRLEARIEALDAEVLSLKKQLERENDALKIKTKVIDDQTDTIKKLKDALLEKDDDVKAAREETLRTQQSLEDQLATEQRAVQELTVQVERLTERKDGLKERVVDLQAELEESQRAYRALDNKWKEKGDIIGQLETQVRQVKENFDQREKKLREERDKAISTEKASVDKLRSIDNAFRKQMEAAQRGHEENMEQLAQEKQRDIDEAMGRVSDVEDEMRQLLAETANQKRVTEEKIRRLTQAFSEIQDLR
ncbi:leucine-rich repeat and coiled-coil domain-containing protein 1 [Strongylocentrotus purpuratus]|uniref:Leucine-rich repeat and coiled-coil domain-containing protein 1 n=1 Tax=Strongylocentrotus purpuratus TaxID=7668 RepID=A0A7M7N771_STRPU|nr:leucine-rich repeat and coiled-coil domain-containing protein 1 [Strongylocentrotus purpuratus]